MACSRGIALTVVTGIVITGVTGYTGNPGAFAGRAAPPAKDDSNTFVPWRKSREWLKIHTVVASSLPPRLLI
jgi:hypothetical protein